MSKLLGIMRRTIENYDMIDPGDSVAVGLSGGKDSMALLYMLKKFQLFSPNSFHLEAITIDMGFNNFDLTRAKVFCENLDVPYSIVETDIAKVVFEIRKEKNPCSLCANMRRGALAEKMNERGLKKLALGHHQDDALATMMMNMLYAGKLNTLEYVSFLSRTNIHVIRPFLDADEKDVIKALNKYDIPVLKSPCPVDKKTKRESIDQLIENLNDSIPHAKKSMATAMRNENQCNLFKKAKK